MSLKWLRDDPSFLPSLEAFIDEAPLSCCEVGFRRSILELRWLPVCETTIEQNHARVSMGMGAKKRAGPVKVSLASRAGIIEQRVSASKDYFNMLLGNFAAGRKVRKLPFQLGIDGHPFFSKKNVLLVYSPVAHRGHLPH